MNLADQPTVPQSVIGTASTEVDIPFNKLHISRKNTRIKPHSMADIECRAASIMAYGLLNRLQVIPEQGSGTEFGVIAGAGRYLSIELLVQRGLVPEDFPVKCDLRSTDDAIAISLVENANRTAPHEADEFVAFKAMADEGKAPETIAAHFGVNVRTVKQRMRLGGLHPELLDLYRNGQMGVEEVRAFCRTTDQERQLQVWNALPSYYRTAMYIRNKLAQESLGSKDPLVMFVGLDQYRQAGGVVTEDLFSADTGDGFVEDLALLHQLAFDKLRAIADQTAAAEGWSWSDVAESYDRRLHPEFELATPQRREPSEAEQAQLSEMEAQLKHFSEKRDSLYDTLDQLAVDEDPDADEQEAEGAEVAESRAEALQREADDAEEQVERLSASIQALKASFVTYADEVRAAGGIIVALDGRGGVEIVRGLMRRAEPEEGASDQQATGSASMASGIPATTVSGTTTAPGSVTGMGFQPAKKERSEISERLALQLSAQRTAVMQAVMMNRPDVAMAATVHRLLEAVTRRHRYIDRDALKISGHSSLDSLHDKAPDLKGMRASDEIKARIDAWRARVPAKASEEFSWLLSLDAADLHELFALCVALSLDATTGNAATQYGVDIASALQIDVADYWTATEASYFSAVSKDSIIAAVEEACGPGTGMPIVKMKKGEAAKYAEQKLVGTRWLPAMLRAPVEEVPANPAPAEVQQGGGEEAAEQAAESAAPVDGGATEATVHSAEQPDPAVAVDEEVTA